jgi:hypothetical protein
LREAGIISGISDVLDNNVAAVPHHVSLKFVAIFDLYREVHQAAVTKMDVQAG